MKTARRPLGPPLLAVVLLGSALAAAAAAAAATATATTTAPEAALFALPYAFEQDDGAQLRLDRWRGQPFLLAMAYSACRETCSYTLHRLEQFDARARARGETIEIVVVSLDPRRDDSRSWSSYRRRHGIAGPHWHFLTGSGEATQQLAALLGVRFWNYEEHVMHEFRIAHVDASGRIDRSLDWASRKEDVFAAASPPCVALDSRGCKP